jgi:hypothetical protein
LNSHVRLALLKIPVGNAVAGADACSGISVGGTGVGARLDGDWIALVLHPTTINTIASAIQTSSSFLENPTCD